MKYDYKGERYTFLDYIKVKLTDRVWEVHVLYEDKDGMKYSREVGEFFERFKELRPNYPPGWSDQLMPYLKEQAKTYIHGQKDDIIE